MGRHTKQIQEISGAGEGRAPTAGTRFSDHSCRKGGIKLAHTQTVKEAGVNRRTIDRAASMIMQDPLLRIVFTNIRPISSLREVAADLKIGVII